MHIPANHYHHHPQQQLLEGAHVQSSTEKSQGPHRNRHPQNHAPRRNHHGRRQRNRTANHHTDFSSDSSASSSDDERIERRQPNRSGRHPNSPQRQPRGRHPHKGGPSGKTRPHRGSQSPACDQAALPPPSAVFALDCEMVGVGPGGHESALARVTLVDWEGRAVYDEYVRQTVPVTDYRTFVSGITAEDLEGATLSLEDCRLQVLRLLEHRILVGHALKNDLRALRISHPWWLTRDTARYAPFQQQRFDDGVLWPRKLKDLARECLQKDVQVAGRPHCPCEDARTALELYRCVRDQWEKVIHYNVLKTNQFRLRDQQPPITIRIEGLPFAQ